MLFLVPDKPSGFIRVFLDHRKKYPLPEEECELNSCYEVNCKWAYIIAFTRTWDSVLWLNRPRASAFKICFPCEEVDHQVRPTSVKHKLLLCEIRGAFRISAMRRRTMAVNYTFLAIQQVILISRHCMPSRILCVGWDFGKMYFCLSLLYSFLPLLHPFRFFPS
jgi:hypothetical protein